MNELKKCLNSGCDQTYREIDNTYDSCCFHPGVAFFHDAYKGWNCCQQKSTDFTTFLNFKGCKRGKHSDLKPENSLKKPEVKQIEEEFKPEVEEEIREKLFDQNHWRPLEITEDKSVKDLVVKDENRSSVCKRCRKSVGKDVNSQCVYHSGEVIFHDSLKYWTCCERKKFTDFEDFNALIGCCFASSHEMSSATLWTPREDFFQTPNKVNLLLYGVKGCRALHSSAETNGKSLKVVLKDSNNSILLEREWTLNRLVSSSESRVVISSTKVELILAKLAPNKYWNKLIE